MTQTDNTIAHLNDRFRRRPTTRGKMYVTPTVMALADRHDDAFPKLIMAVRSFNAFTPDNDPYGEHDFGAIEMHGEKWFWKIDYYADANCEWGAEDPADETKCFRVLTVMHASEY